MNLSNFLPSCQVLFQIFANFAIYTVFCHKLSFATKGFLRRLTHSCTAHSPCIPAQSGRIATETHQTGRARHYQIFENRVKGKIKKYGKIEHFLGRTPNRARIRRCRKSAYGGAPHLYRVPDWRALVRRSRPSKSSPLALSGILRREPPVLLHIIDKGRHGDTCRSDINHHEQRPQGGLPGRRHRQTLQRVDDEG